MPVVYVAYCVIRVFSFNETPGISKWSSCNLPYNAMMPYLLICSMILYLHNDNEFRIYMYMYVCVCVCIYVCVYTYMSGSEVEWAECLLIIGTGCRVFLAWSSIAQSVCQQAFSLLANRCLRPLVPILHSAEEDCLSPFDSNIACLCQSIEINNNKHVYMHVWLCEQDHHPFKKCLAAHAAPNHYLNKHGWRE